MVTDNPDSNEWNPRFQRREHVTLPPWVNEPLPGFSDLLSAHDVARLTRRSRWVLSGFMLLGLNKNNSPTCKVRKATSL